MEQHEIKEAIRAKAIELEVAMESARPRSQLLKIYKELKELQFKTVQADLENEPDARPASPDSRNSRGTRP